MGYRNENSAFYDDTDHSIDFFLKDKDIAQAFIDTLKNMAFDAIKDDDYKKTLDIVSLLVEGEAALKKFDQPKFEPTYPRTGTGLLEDE